MMSVEDILIQSGDISVEKNTPPDTAATTVATTPATQPTPEQLATLNSQKPSQAPTETAKVGTFTKEQRETFLFWKEVGLAVLWVIFLILSTIAVAKNLKGK